MNRKKPETVIRDLVRAMKDMACTFWACEGPKNPQHMITCSKCWAIHDAQQWLKKQKGGAA